MTVEIDNSDRTRPEVTIGIPVYNGANFVACALESALAQSDVDLEVVVVDNGSTDETSEILSRYAANDSRVRVERSEVNRGASYSFNRTFELARGRYFRWAAHDDVFGAAFTRKCIDALEANPEASVAVTTANMIDASGEVVEELEDFTAASGDNPVSRAFEIMVNSRWCLHIFGVMRTDQLRGTGLIGPFAGSDHVTLMELALQGPFLLVDDRIFGNREHEGRSVRAYGENRERDRDHWFDPNRDGAFTLPRWRLISEYWRGVVRSPVGARTKFKTMLLFPRVCLNEHHRSRLMWEPLGYIYRRSAALAAAIRGRRR